MTTTVTLRRGKPEHLRGFLRVRGCGQIAGTLFSVTSENCDFHFAVPFPVV